jgi:hypothetical protein
VNATTWGSTAREREMPLPCDAHLRAPDAVLHRAISVDAPPERVFRWLCQLRAAPYSYDLIDNWGRRSPQELTPGLDDLAVGQRVMTLFDLVDFERDRHITLVLRRGGWALGGAAVTYAVVPAGPDRCRLVVRIASRRGGGAKPLARVLPWLDLFMMRRQLLNLKRLSERPAEP